MWSSWISSGSDGCIWQLLHLSPSTKTPRIKIYIHEKYKQTFQRCNWQLFLAFHMPRNAAKQQEAVINSKMNKNRQRKHSRGTDGDNGKRGQMEGRGQGGDITGHAEVIMFYFIVLYFPHMMFHSQDLIITRLGGRGGHFRKWLLFFFKWYFFGEAEITVIYCARPSLSVSGGSLSYTRAHPQTPRLKPE